MNTRKQVLLMSALLALMLIVVGIYGAWYPYRETDAEAEFEKSTAERAAILFSNDCRLCHGDVGEGGAAGDRLPAAPALDRSDLQGFVASEQTITADVLPTVGQIEVSDSARFSKGSIILIDLERMEVTGVNGNTLSVKRGSHGTEAVSHLNGAAIQLFDQATLDEKITLITNTLTCGRIGSAMQPKAQSQGGPLSDEQIRQLMTLITQDYWDYAAEVNDEHDERSELTVALPADATTLTVKDNEGINPDEYIRIGDEHMRVVSIPEGDRTTVEVERGIQDTTATDHAEGDIVYNFPKAPDEPTILQSSCGQTYTASAPAGDPELIEPFDGQSVEVTALNIAFDTNEITVDADGQVRVRLHNEDEGVQHNIAVYNSSSDITPVSDGSVGLVFEGVATDDTVFDIPAAGEYYFRCDIHPSTMTGTFIVQ